MKFSYNWTILSARQITELFYKYSDDIEKKEMQNGEFDCYIRRFRE